jgi:hypothetical protein
MSIAATRFAASPAVAAQGTRAARFALVLAGCFIGFLGVTYLQRIGYVVDRTSQVPISVLTTGLALALFYCSGLFWVSVKRLTLCVAAFAALILAFEIGLPLRFSLLSLFFLFVLYMPYVFLCELTEEEYKRVLGVFQKMMVPIALVAVAQFALTMTGRGWWDFLYLLPEKIVLTGYNTHPPMGYGSPIIRANGEFFLEPSFISQFMALGILIDILYFGVGWRVALFAGGMLGSLSGTGFILLAIVAAYVMVTRQQWGLLAVGIAAVVALFLLRDAPVIGDLIGRLGEFQSEESSSFVRFIAPFRAIPDALGNDLLPWFAGVGPGMSKEISFGGYVVNPFAISKLIIENGLIGAIPFIVFVTYCFFARTFSKPIATALYLMYMVLSGSLQQPHTVYLFLFISILFAPRHEAMPGRPARPLPVLRYG